MVPNNRRMAGSDVFLGGKLILSWGRSTSLLNSVSFHKPTAGKNARMGVKIAFLKPLIHDSTSNMTITSNS